MRMIGIEYSGWLKNRRSVKSLQCGAYSPAWYWMCSAMRGFKCSFFKIMEPSLIPAPPTQCNCGKNPRQAISDVSKSIHIFLSVVNIARG